MLEKVVLVLPLIVLGALLLVSSRLLLSPSARSWPLLVRIPSLVTAMSLNAFLTFGTWWNMASGEDIAVGAVASLIYLTASFGILTHIRVGQSPNWKGNGEAS